MRFDHRIFCNEADTVSLSYTPCYVRMARHCYEASHVLADPFINLRVCFFLSDSTKAVNPFLDRIPTELQEQYITDCVTELMKMKITETNNNTDDDIISFKYGLMVAFARKTWKLQPSIGRYVQI